MNYYDQIRDELINNEVYKKVKDYSKNRSDLSTYYNVGKLLIESQGGEERSKYGDRLIKEYSEKLTKEIGKGYTFTALSRMRQFYIMFKNVVTVSQQLTWSHYVELLKFDDISKINYYIDISIKLNLSVRELRHKIKNLEYERLSDETKEKLLKQDEYKINDFIKNPLVIKINYDIKKVNEKILKQSILEDLDNFLIELGEGFTYIKNEYKIKVGNRYNFIDLLLFNYKYNCFVVVELKVTEVKAEHIDQIKKYMNYIDKNIKTINQEKTIGVIIVRKDNQFIMDYCSDPRIFRSKYQLIN